MADGMTADWVKRLYYGVLRPPMWLNGRLYAALRQPRTPLKVHLGPGKGKYVPGWLNVDGNIVSARLDLWADLRDRLPFRDNSVATIYSFHVIEHLPDRVLPRHFADMFRVLQPGGAIRIGGPDIGNACKKYLENDLAWFSDFPDRRDSIGGRFANFVFCRGEHLMALSESYLRELAHKAGFVDIERRLPCRDSGVVGREILDTEYESDFETPHSVVIEARKPSRATAHAS